MTRAPDHIAVLTGDLVNSTGLGEASVARAFDALAACAMAQAAWQGDSLRFTRHRGDGWQVALGRPELAFRACLAFRAALRALGEEYDSYIGLAIGPVTAPLGPDLNAETDPVFAASGHALEAIKLSKTAPSHLHYHGTDAATGPHQATLYLLDTLSRGWTPVQAEILTQALAPPPRPSFTALAETVGKSRQSVTKSLDAAHFPAIELALAALEHAAAPD